MHLMPPAQAHGCILRPACGRFVDGVSTIGRPEMKRPAEAGLLMLLKPKLVLERCVFREILVRVGIATSIGRVADSQALRTALAIHNVIGIGDDIEVAGFMHQGAGF